MSHDSFSFRAALVCGALCCIVLGGCGDSNPLTPQERDLASLRQAVQSFHDLSAAQQAGYTVAVADPSDGHTCLAAPPLGAMGVHYLNTAVVDDTAIVTKPEIMIYEPQQDGSYQFVGVEYIIPYSIHGENEAPPVLFGEQFSKNATFQLWGLHAWVGRTNPSGMFAMWNPDVSCQYGH